MTVGAVSAFEIGAARLPQHAATSHAADTGRTDQRAHRVGRGNRNKDSDAAEEIRTLFAPPPVPVAENENGDDPDSPSTDIEPVTEA